MVLILAPIWRPVWTNSALYLLCATQSGPKYIKQIPEGSSYLRVDKSYAMRGNKVYGCDEDCTILLLRGEFASIEFYVNSSSPNLLPVSEGYVSYYLADENSKECAKYNKALHNPDFIPAKILAGSGKCLTYKKLSKPQSSIIYDNKKSWVEFLGLSFRKFTDGYFLNGKDPVFQFDSFLLSPREAKGNFSFFMSRSCGNFLDRREKDFNVRTYWLDQ